MFFSGGSGNVVRTGGVKTTMRAYPLEVVPRKLLPTSRLRPLSNHLGRLDVFGPYAHADEPRRDSL